MSEDVCKEEKDFFDNDTARLISKSVVAAGKEIVNDDSIKDNFFVKIARGIFDD